MDHKINRVVFTDLRVIYTLEIKFKHNNNDFKKELAQSKESTLAGKIQNICHSRMFLSGNHIKLTIIDVSAL